MDQVDYLETLDRFESDLMEIRERLYEAVEEELSAKERTAAMDAGKQKLAEYDTLLAEMDDMRKAQIRSFFDEHVDIIKERLTRLERN